MHDAATIPMEVTPLAHILQPSRSTAVRFDIDVEVEHHRSS